MDLDDWESLQGREAGYPEQRHHAYPASRLCDWRQKVIVAWCAICALLLSFHFIATFLYLAPSNPISEQSASILNGYIKPYFHQNWELFAPDPVDYNTRVLVRAKARDSTGIEKTTDWTDISKPGIDKVRGSLFPARLSRLVIGGYQMMTEAGVEPAATSPKTEDATPDGAGPPDPIARRQAVRHMSAIATLAARAQWGNRITAVQVRISNHVVPRFSDRNWSDGGNRYHRDFDWWPPSPVTNEAVKLWKEAFG
ncbi:DUF5819 family protein [Nonomuraea sp. NPDC004580]|uniref:DUF5819 family protein n=1 Tax=Nonomuraea sp. NPDC004580 TaxID=3154552 RepID=UPI0033AB3549